MLDLFAGRVGGGAAGYRRAGFYVIGVDKEDCPDYAGDEFYRGDVFKLARGLARRAVAVHASPPCPGEGYLSKGTDPTLLDRHPQLIGPTRDLLDSIGLPYVIENVGG